MSSVGPAAGTIRLVDAIEAASGSLSPRWRDAFTAVDRRHFTPHVWTNERVLSANSPTPASRDSWAEMVASDQTLITAIDDAQRPIASSPRPSVVAAMLAALDVDRHHRVLEVGTGTGWQTALLCHVHGPAALTTIEADPAVSDQARNALWHHGRNPVLSWGDLLQGHSERAPFHRLISTRAPWRIPTSWLAQMTPGGIMIVPLGAGIWRFTVDEHGTATGRPLPIPTTSDFLAARPAGTPDALPTQEMLTLSSTGGHEIYAGRLARAFRAPELIALATLALPDVQHHTDLGPPWWTLWADPASRSWARLHAKQIATHDGPRQLLLELDALYVWWGLAEQPASDRWGLTVTPDGTHTLWVDQAGQHELALSALEEHA